MKKTCLLLIAVCGFTMLVTGCAKMQEVTRAKPANVSPFLPHPELMVLQKATFPFHYFYLKKNAGTYKNVYIAPVNVKYLRENKNWAKLDQKMAKQLGTDISHLATYTQRTFRDAFRNAKGPQKLTVVYDGNAPKTLTVELAIVTIIPSKAELVILGTAANFILPGIGILTGHIAQGSVTMECIVRDARTKEIIAMFANTEVDQKALINVAGMTWYNSAKNNITKQAENTAKVFSGQDYSSIYRRLIKIIEL